MLKFIQYIFHHKQFNIYYVFILRKKLQKIGIIFVAINLLACSHQPDFKDLKHLAESGDAGAQAKLGELYVEGQVVPQDYKKAFEWYSKAANQGNSEAQNNLGAMYALGQGVEQNYKKHSNGIVKLLNKEK